MGVDIPMLWAKTRRMLDRLNALSRGYCECRGIFRITDGSGNLLDGVTVNYRVGESGWIPCGHSHGDALGAGNFFQLSGIFYRIGDPVSWHFSKEGYTETTVTRYTADMGFNEELDTVVLCPRDLWGKHMSDVDDQEERLCDIK